MESTITSADGKQTYDVLVANIGSDKHTITVGKNDSDRERKWVIHYDNGCKTLDLPIVQDACPCELSVSPTSLSFDCAKGSSTVQIKSSKPWSATRASGDGGCTLSATSGGESETTLSVNVTSNTTESARSWTWRFETDCKAVNVTVTQDACKNPDPDCPCTIDVGAVSVVFDCKTDSKRVSVTSSGSWSSSVNGGPGLTVTSAGSKGESMAMFAVTENTTGELREWDIVFTGHSECGDECSKTVHVTQEACPCELSVSSESLAFGCAKGSSSVQVESTTKWTATRISGDGGCSLSIASGGEGVTALSVNVTSNTTDSVRTWTWHFETDCMTKDVTVTQEACKEDKKCFIFADKARIAVDGCGSATRKVEINASGNWTSRVEGGPGLNVTPSGGAGKTTAVFNMDESALCSTRQWTVVFTLVGSECGEVSTSVDVEQTCPCGCQISVAPSKRTVGAGMRLGLVTVDSSHAWTIDWHSVPSWVVPLVGAGGAGTTVVPYLVRKQPSCDDGVSAAAREAKVRFVSSEGCSDTFVLVQEGRECCTYLDIYHDGEELQTFVTNNTAFSLPLGIRSSSAWSVASLPPWISLGSEDHNSNVLTLNVPDNAEDGRSGEVRLANESGNVRVLTVVQTNETFTVEPRRVFLPGTAEETSLTVSGTSDWTLTIPDEAKTWLSAQRELTDDSKVTLALRENATGEIRETELVFSCGLITKEVTVVQDSLGMRLAIVGETALQGDESTALKCYLVQPGGGAEEVLPDWSVEGPDEVCIDEGGTLRVEGTLLAEAVVTVTARYEQGEQTFSARHEVTIEPRLGPGVWTHDVASALAAAKVDGKLIAVLVSKPDTCSHCREFEPVAFNPEFLKWAHDNKVYLIQAVRSGPCDESVTDAYFWTLAESLGKSGSVSLPALAFAYPEAQDIGIGLDCARVGEQIGTVEYDGSVQTLIEGVASYLKSVEPAKTFAEALGVPELECVPWGDTKSWQLRIDPKWTCDGNGSAKVGNNLREWTATPGFSFGVTGPTQMKFSYSKSFSLATFSVDCTAGELYRDDTPGEKTGWKQVVVDIPAGEQTVYFKVRLGDAALHLNEEYDYNGFWVDDLQFGEFEHDRPDPVEYHTVTFDLGEHGIRTGGGELTQTVGEGGVAVVPTFDVDEGWKFAGWDKPFTSVTADLTVKAQYEKVQSEPDTASDLYPSGTDKPFTGEAAATYDGYLLDAGGAVVGTVNVKTAKVKTDRKTGAKTSAVTVTVNELGHKKRTLKATLDLSTGELSYKVWPAPELAIGRDGISGSYSYGHDCTVVCARNFFTAKPAEKGDVLAKFNGRIYTVALKTEDNGGNEFADGYSTLSIAIGAKGKVKTTGVLADGTKVSVTGQLLVGANGVCCVPVLAQLYSGKSGGFGFLLKLDAADPLSAKVDALSVWNGEGAKPDSFEATWSVASAGMLGALNGGSVFNLEKVWERLNGVEPVQVLLPLNESVQTGTKWFVAKADKVKLEKSGSLTYGVNSSGLKLTYTAKTGLFKGSFSVYTLVNGKLKKVSATVNGVVVNGDGYGTATVKKVGSVPVVINGNYKEAGEDPAPVAATNDFKAQITGIAVVLDFGNYDPAKLTFMSPSTPVTVPFGHSAIFRVAYDFPEGYAAGVWLGSSWPEDESYKEYYFGYNPSAYYRGSGVAYGFITLDEEVGRACRLREAVVDTQSDPWLSSPWTIAREAVDITFEGSADESGDPEIPPSQDEEGAY